MDKINITFTGTAQEFQVILNALSMRPIAEASQLFNRMMQEVNTQIAAASAQIEQEGNKPQIGPN